MTVLPPLPQRPRLLPGAGIYRRDDRHLQVGLGAPRRVVLVDHPEVRTLLRSLEDPGSYADPAPSAGGRAAGALTALAAAGLLVGSEALADCLRSARAAGGLDAAGVAAAFCEAPVDAPRRLRERAQARVRVDAEPGTRAEARALLDASGVGLHEPGAEPTLVLVVGHEPDREAVDDLVRQQVPHLLVGTRLESYVVGPFVVPGRTACLRCLDAHLGERDPRRAVVLVQHARRPRGAAGPLEPSDPALRALATAWAVRDVVRHLDGERPSTWSATTTLGPDLVPEHVPLLRHPHCGCAWDVLATG